MEERTLEARISEHMKTATGSAAFALGSLYGHSRRLQLDVPDTVLDGAMRVESIAAARVYAAEFVDAALAARGGK